MNLSIEMWNLTRNSTRHYILFKPCPTNSLFPLFLKWDKKNKKNCKICSRHWLLILLQYNATPQKALSKPDAVKYRLPFLHSLISGPVPYRLLHFSGYFSMGTPIQSRLKMRHCKYWPRWHQFLSWEKKKGIYLLLDYCQHCTNFNGTDFNKYICTKLWSFKICGF